MGQQVLRSRLLHPQHMPVTKHFSICCSCIDYPPPPAAAAAALLILHPCSHGPASAAQQAAAAGCGTHHMLLLPEWHCINFYPGTDLSLLLLPCIFSSIMQPWAGKCCAAGSSCIRNNEWYYNCQPESTGSNPHTSNVKRASQQQQQQPAARAAAPPAPAVPARKSAGVKTRATGCNHCVGSTRDGFIGLVIAWCSMHVVSHGTIRPMRRGNQQCCYATIVPSPAVWLSICPDGGRMTMGRCWACPRFFWSITEPLPHHIHASLSVPLVQVLGLPCVLVCYCSCFFAV
jgi:hypothetical protein